MEIVLKHGVTYTTHGVVPVSIVAETLLAHDALIRQAVDILKESVDGLELEVKSIRISDLSNNSPLKEIFGIALFVAFQEGLEAEVPYWVEQITGLNVPDKADTIVTVAVMMVAFFVLDSIFHTVKDFRNVRREKDRMIQAVADLLGKPRDEVEQELHDRFSDKPNKSLLNSIIRMFRPVTLDPGSEMHLSSGHIIDSDVIKEVPTDTTPDTDEATHVEHLNDAVLDVHSSDKDYQKQGWAAVIDSISPKRVPLLLAPTVDQAALFGKNTVRGDVIIFKQKDASGDFVPSKYYLNNVTFPLGANKPAKKNKKKG